MWLERRDAMKKLNQKELFAISGGFSLTGSVISAVVSGVGKLIDLGRALGSSIRRIGSGNLCEF